MRIKLDTPGKAYPHPGMPSRSKSPIPIAPRSSSIWARTPPRLWPDDVERVHRIWLQLTEESPLGCKLHHRDVVGVALRRLEEDLIRADHSQIVRAIEEESSQHEV